MGLPILKERVRTLERKLLQAQTASKCTCRSGQETRYHHAAELARISKMRCAVHGLRDLGDITWVPQDLPLRQEDQDFCSCPPAAVRDFLQGTRGPLSREEHAEACRVWDLEFTEDAQERFCTDQVQVRQLLQQYEGARRRAHAGSSAMSRQDKRG
jgi:hypothetical protein